MRRVPPSGGPWQTDAVPDEPYAVCEGCGDLIDPSGPDVVRAVELVPLPGMGEGASDVAEGLPLVFHEACFVDSPRYRRV